MEAAGAMSDTCEQPPTQASTGPASTGQEAAEDARTSGRPIELLFITRISEILDTQDDEDSV